MKNRLINASIKFECDTEVPLETSNANPIEKINRDHAFVLVGAKGVIVRELISDRGFPEVRFITMDAFRNYHANYKVDGSPAAKLWLESEDRRTYDGICFSPSGDTSADFFNLWRGFAVEPKPNGSCELFLDHLYKNICSGNDTYFRYLTGYLANMIQDPEDKPGVAVALRGGKGTGKTAIGDYLSKILGPHYLKISQAKHLTGNFNGHMDNRLLVFADEGYWAGDPSQEGPLKDLITSDEHMIERKGVDPIVVRNLVRVMFATNNDWVVPASGDERRYFVLDVADNRRQDHAYFDQYYKELNGSGPGALLHYLQTFDYSGLNLRYPPSTNALVDQKIRSMGNAAQWWYACLQEGQIGDFAWRLDIAKQDVHDAYLNYAKKVNERHLVAESTLGKSLHQWTDNSIGSARSSTGKRPRVYKLPLLEDARRKFSEFINADLDWDD
jgi:hypothetical protein